MSQYSISLSNKSINRYPQPINVDCSHIVVARATSSCLRASCAPIGRAFEIDCSQNPYCWHSMNKRLVVTQNDSSYCACQRSVISTRLTKAYCDSTVRGCEDTATSVMCITLFQENHDNDQANFWNVHKLDAMAWSMVMQPHTSDSCSSNLWDDGVQSTNLPNLLQVTALQSYVKVIPQMNSYVSLYDFWWATIVPFFPYAAQIINAITVFTGGGIAK